MNHSLHQFYFFWSSKIFSFLFSIRMSQIFDEWMDLTRISPAACIYCSTSSRLFFFFILHYSGLILHHSAQIIFCKFQVLILWDQLKLWTWKRNSREVLLEFAGVVASFRNEMTWIEILMQSFRENWKPSHVSNYKLMFLDPKAILLDPNRFLIFFCSKHWQFPSFAWFFHKLSFRKKS